MKPSLLKERAPSTYFGTLCTLINLLMASSPFVVPRSASQLGFLPTVVLFSAIVFASYLNILFYLESNQILYSLHKPQPIEQQTLLQEKNEKSDQKDSQQETPYFELGHIGSQLYGPWMKNFVNAVVICYLLGVLIVKAIIGSESLKFGVVDSLSRDFYGYVKMHFFLDLYFPCLFFFALAAVYFCTLKQQAQSKFQQGIIVIRVLVLALMLYGSGIYILQGGKIDNLHHVNLDLKQGVVLSSNIVLYIIQIYGFLLHHSLPVLSRNIDFAQMKKSYFAGYMLVAGCLLLISGLAIVAFGHLSNSCHISFPCKISVLYNENFLDLRYVGNIINFYLVLSVSAFPVQVKAIQNSVCNAFNIQDSMQKKFVKMTIFSLIIFTSVFFKNKLTTILEIMGGVNGVFIAVIFPSLFLIKARQIAKIKLDDEIPPKFLTSFSDPIWPYLMILFGMAQILLTLFIKFFNH